VKSKFITDLQDPFDSFNPLVDEAYPNFAPSVENSGGANPVADFPLEIPPVSYLSSSGAASTSGQSGAGSVVAVNSGGLTINLLFDAAAMAAPASFRAAIEQAVTILGASISDKLTVNLKIDYSGTGGGAAAGPDNGLYESYSSIRADLINTATPGDTTFNALPSGSSVQGQSNVAVWNAQLKLWGLLGANDTTTDDGSATFATDINPSLLVGVALHELTHALGRVPYGSQPDILDLFRYTSPGTHLFADGNIAPAAYFSLDGGHTKLADFGRNSDPSDFLNSGVQGPNDPFNEYYTGTTSQSLTTVDKELLDALGFHTTSPVNGQSSSSPTGFTIAGTGDFNHNGLTDILFQNLTSGAVATWEANPGQVIGTAPSGYNVVDAADFNGDGTTDILFQNTSGYLVEWKMNAGQVSVESGLGQTPSGFKFAATGDINHDGTSDVLFQNNDNGAVAAWLISNEHVAVEEGLGAAPSGFRFAGTGDFNHDGTTDILFQNASNGAVAVWEMNGGHVAVEAGVGILPSGFKVAGVGDLNQDGTTDVLLQNPTNGFVAEWIINQGHVAIEAGLGVAPANSKISAVADVNHDGTMDVLFQDNSTGAIHVWDMVSGHISAQATLDWVLA
jgi:hypothetical protein